MKTKFTSLKALVAMAAMACTPLTTWAGIGTTVEIPAPKADGVRGATMPYTRYDSENAVVSGGAKLVRSLDWDPTNRATQASEQSYVDLGNGGAVEWTVGNKDPRNQYVGDGVTIRFTIDDGHRDSATEEKWDDYNGSFDVYVNGEFDQTVKITSFHMWQYFNFGSGSVDDSKGNIGGFAFDETHFRLKRILKNGDKIKIQHKSGSGVGVDFIETEVVPAAYDPSEDAGSRQIFDVTKYGASQSSSNNQVAFNKAVAAASAVGGIVYIPEGTWKMDGMWSITAKDIKICGAGIWYTNLQFTNPNRFGGGISGGNPSNTGGKNTMDNIEFCNMYINSGLASRYGENAVYKCFMDIWCGDSWIHDIWEEHFECGFWFADYNSAQLRTCDGVRVTNCRIRNNFADGVNFCRGTSNAAVINCSIRNGGDDGLANWNDNNPKDESNITFAYNTIDLIWRAGAVAVYGGDDIKVYNNYICDTFMASGIHMNTTFPGYKFNNTKSILVANNYLVRAGTDKECWGRDYAAIDLEQEIKNVTFQNNEIYDSPAEALRVINNPSGVTFDGLYINRAGLAKRTSDYSASNHTLGAGNLSSSAATGVTWKDVTVVKNSVPEATVGGSMEQYKSWPWWDHAPSNWSWTDEDKDTPPYPDAAGIIPDPNPYDELYNYDAVMTGLSWTTNKGGVDMEEGDVVTLKVRVDNDGATSIPAGAKIVVKVTVDDKDVYTQTLKEGLAGKGNLIVEVGEWTATKGKHTFKAEVDPNGLMLHEANKTNNTRVKEVNVAESEEHQEIVLNRTTGGANLEVVKVGIEDLSGNELDEITVGQEVVFKATVANVGDAAIPAGQKIGVQFNLDEQTYGTGYITWNDQYNNGLQPGQIIELTATGGGGSSAAYGKNNYSWTATNGSHTVNAWADDQNLLTDTDISNNQLSITVEIPKPKTEFNNNPDEADDLNHPGQTIPYTDNPDVNFDLAATGLNWNPASKTFSAGTTVNQFVGIVKNNSGVDVPAGTAVKVTVNIDGASVATATFNDGLAAGQTKNVTLSGSYTATAGGHTATLVIANVKGDTNNANNKVERTFNATGSATPGITEWVNPAASGSSTGIDLIVSKVTWKNAGQLHTGDDVIFIATVKNIGTVAAPANVKKGIQFQIAGSTSDIRWCDTHNEGIAPGEEIILEANGGSGSTPVWKAADNTLITAWVNDTHDVANENEENNKFTFTVNFAETGSSAPVYIDNPTGPDNLDTNGILINYVKEQNDEIWYMLNGSRVKQPAQRGVYVRNGKKVVVK